MKNYLIISLLLTSSFALSAKKKLTAQQRGYNIAKWVDEKNSGFQGESSEMQMILIDANKNRIERLMNGKVLELPSDGDKSSLRFTKPFDIKGTTMLTWSHKTGDDDQWFYMPSIRRTKRISGSSRNNAFMGSEFTFEDLTSQELDKYEYKFIKEEKKSGDTIFVIEKKSKEKSGYSKMVVHISKKYASAVKVDYYNRRDELLKTAESSDWEEFKVGKKAMYRANTIHMKNIQTKKESLIKWDNRKLGVKFAEREFNKNNIAK